MSNTGDKELYEISIRDVYDALKYKPMHPCLDPDEWLDGVAFFMFRKHNKMSPSLEYCFEDGHLYFEVIDLDGYVEGEIFTDDRRRHVINNIVLDKSNFNEVMSKINGSLRSVYKRK